MFIRLQGEGRWSPAQGWTCPQDCSYPLAQQGSHFSRFFKLPFFISDKAPVCLASPLSLERHFLVFYSFWSDSLVSVSVVISNYLQKMLCFHQIFDCKKIVTVTYYGGRN